MEHGGRTFDRVPQPDPKNWPIRALLGPTQKLRGYTWALGTVLDQGQEGACVGFSFAHELAARPVPVDGITNDTGRWIYHGAQKLDDWPGEAYEGTSVLAGAKFLTAGGHFAEYRWADSVFDLALAVAYHGPAVLGVNWHEDSFDPDADGTLHITGATVGGHAIICRGVSAKTRRFRLTNSWGRSWGMDGDAFVSWSDMEALLHDDGEACIPIARARSFTTALRSRM